MTYRTYRFGGRDVLTVPMSPSAVRKAGVGVFPGATPRARAYRSAIRGLVSFGADCLVARDAAALVTVCNGIDCEAFVRALGEQLGRDDLSPVVVYPRQHDRDRLYVHLLAADGERIAFAKLAETARGELQADNEARALTRIGEVGPERFRYPSLLGVGTFAQRRYVLLAPLPLRSRPLPPRWTPTIQGVQQELAGTACTRPRLDAATWWPRFARHVASNRALAALAAPIADAPFVGSVAHGDFVNWNFHNDEHDLWLFDWEGYAEDAPILSDRVRFILGIHTRRIAMDPWQGAQLLRAEFGCDEREQRADVARALAFLSGNGVAAALAIGAIWNEAVHR